MRTFTDQNSATGQTLFQFLKRKQCLALKNIISNSIKNENNLFKQQASIFQIDGKLDKTEQKKQASQRSTKRMNKKSSQKKKKSPTKNKQNISELANLSQNIFKQQRTSRRCFLNNKEEKQSLVATKNSVSIQKKTPARSFISMISPLKREIKPMKRNSLDLQKIVNEKTAPELCSKKIIRQTINKFQKYFEEGRHFQEQIQEKLGYIFIMVNSLLNSIEDFNSNSEFKRKSKELKSAMITINGFVNNKLSKKFDQAQLPDFFQNQLNQIIDSIKQQLKRKFQSSFEATIIQLKIQYEQKIEELALEKKSLKKQINSVNYEYNKLEEKHQKLVQQFSFYKQSSSLQFDKIRFENKSSLQNLQEKIKQLTAQNNGLVENLRTVEKELKISAQKFESHSLQAQVAHTQTFCERQSLLLSQLNSIKAQFASDIKNFHNYHTSKQEQLFKKIRSLQSLIQEQKGIINQLQIKIKQNEGFMKFDLLKGKESSKKIDGLIVDLCQINRQLYKYWLALKDIKILLSRLNIFHIFQNIYKDVLFDQRLF